MAEGRELGKCSRDEIGAVTLPKASQTIAITLSPAVCELEATAGFAAEEGHDLTDLERIPVTATLKED